MRQFVGLLGHELRTQDRMDAILCAGFFFTVLVASPTVEILNRDGFAVLFWLGGLLACLLSADRLFSRDYRSGVIDQVLCSSLPMSLYAGTKLLAWLAVPGLLVWGLGCLAHVAVFGPAMLERVALGLLLALPGMVALVGIAAALTVDAVRGGALVVLAVLPLSLPLIVFGTASLEQGGHALVMLAGASLVNVSLAPYLIGLALADAVRR